MFLSITEDSFPLQLAFFQVQRGPWKEVTFYQCKWTPLTENGGPTTAYTLLWFVVLFALPLATMSVSYSLIVYSVFKKSKELSEFRGCLVLPC